MNLNNTHNKRLIIVDDDFDLRDSLLGFFSQSNFEVTTFASGTEMLLQLSEGFNGVIVCDLQMPGMSGLEVLAELSKKDNPPPLILMTAYGDVPTAVKAMQSGAYDFIEKPFDPTRLKEKLERASQSRHLALNNLILRKQISELKKLDQQLLGDSPQIKVVRDQLIDYANSDSNILIEGETGVGKTLLASLIHLNSKFANQAQISTNCATALSSQFDPISSTEHSLLLQARHTSLVLDDIHELTVELQNALISALDRVDPSITESPHSTRIISTVPYRLSQTVELNPLRQDLFYRLGALVIYIPPLRDRLDDILQLFTTFKQRYEQQHQLSPVSLENADLSSLTTYQWPGNVRELKHCAERYVLANQRTRSSIQSLLDAEPAPVSNHARNLRQQVEQFEKALIRQSLVDKEGHIANVCKHLNIPRRTLNEKLLKYDLNRLDFIRQ